MLPVESFEAARPLLLGIAYRMLGSLAEAEDVVQDAWLRATDAAPAGLRSERAWLSSVVTHLCLDRLKSARVRRESYVGEWLPEPVATDGEAGSLAPAIGDREGLSLAVLALCERLSPVERAVYVLAEGFDFSHAEIADILGRSDGDCRQLLHRARARIDEGRARFTASRADRERLLGRLASAIAFGDLDGLRALLAADATLVSDGGGRVKAARKEVRGGQPCARFLYGVVKKHGLPAGVELTFREINAAPAVVLRRQGRVLQVLSIEADAREQRITAVRMVLNPDKLTRV